MPFCERGGMTARVTDFSHRKIGTEQSPFRRGGDMGIRTPDLLHAKQPLSQLSYTPVKYLEQATGVEPATTAWEAIVLPLNYAYKSNGCQCDTVTSAYYIQTPFSIISHQAKKRNPYFKKNHKIHAFFTVHIFSAPSLHIRAASYLFYV